VSLNPLGPAVSAHRSGTRLALLAFKRRHLLALAALTLTSRRPDGDSDLAPPQPDRDCKGPSKAASASPPASLPADGLNHQQRRFGPPPQFNPLPLL
jgi:hypothetical protein